MTTEKKSLSHKFASSGEVTHSQVVEALPRMKDNIHLEALQTGPMQHCNGHARNQAGASVHIASSVHETGDTHWGTPHHWSPHEHGGAPHHVRGHHGRTHPTHGTPYRATPASRRKRQSSHGSGAHTTGRVLLYTVRHAPRPYVSHASTVSVNHMQGC